MGIRKYNPTTPAAAGRRVSDFAELTPGRKPEKSLLRPKTKTGGRNNQGKITARHRGGGHKRRYRLIDFRRNKDGVPAKVDSIQYDPNRTARIALLHYVDGEKRYILAPHGLKAGDMVMSGAEAPPNVGNCLPLTKIPLGMTIHNIELQPGRGGCAVPQRRHQRDADGSRSRLGADHAAQRRNSPYSVRLPGDDRHDRQCRSHERSCGKAGRNRWMGRRPHVRGTAMNPIDHPHGGGEGRTKGGRHPVSPTGKRAKGGMTRKRRKASNKAIVRRRRRRRYGVKLKISNST